VLYLFAAIIIILVVFTLFRLNEIREVNKRGASRISPLKQAKQKRERVEEESTGIKEIGEVSEGTTQDYFDRWFSNGKREKVARKSALGIPIQSSFIRDFKRFLLLFPNSKIPMPRDINIETPVVVGFILPTSA
jgi:hypothetical protein